MTGNDITYANEMGKYLGPLLKLIRATGFFEAYIFIPSMTLLSIYIFMRLRKKLKRNNTFNAAFRSRFKWILLTTYYSLCFLLTNALAVAFKTLIIEEMDYTTSVWFLHLVSPLHFYIASVTIIYLWLLYRNQHKTLDQVFCIYIQIGILGGYYAGIYRILNEPFEIANITTGISGILFLIWFFILNADIVVRFFNKGYN